jgi:hypothetical protein
LADDAVTRADDLHLLLVARRDALDHVGDERAGQAVQRARGALVVGPRDLDGAAVTLADPDGLGDGESQLALGSLDGDRLAVDGDVDTGGHGDGEASNTRHVSLPYQT